MKRLLLALLLAAFSSVLMAQASRTADRQMLLDDPCVLQGHLPTPERHHRPSVRGVPVIERSSKHKDGIENLA